MHKHHLSMRKVFNHNHVLVVWVLFCLALVLPVHNTLHARDVHQDVVDDTSISVKNTDYPVSADAYFVAPNGDDTNPGTKEAPWATPKKAVSAAPAGATIVLREGTYRGGVAVLKPLTLQPYPNEEVWIKGSRVVTTWSKEGNIWRSPWTDSEDSISSWTNFGCPEQNPRCYLSENYPMADFPDMVFVGGQALVQVGSKDAVQEGTFFVDAEVEELYIGTDPTNKEVEATADHIGIYADERGSGSTIRGLGMAHFTRTGMLLSHATDVMVENNTSVWNAVTGIDICCTHTIAVKGNVSLYNGMHGMGVGAAKDIVITDNWFAHNNVEHFNRFWNAAGFKLVDADNAVVRANTVEDNDANGIWLDVDSTGGVITENVTQRNNGGGIYYELTDGGVIIAGNTAVENEVGIEVRNATQAQIYNNTLVDNGRPLNVITDDRSPKVVDTIIKNNLFSNATNYTGERDDWEPFVFFHWGDCSSATSMVAELDHNAYYRTDAAIPKNLIHWSNTNTDYCRERYTTLTAFQEAYPFEANGLSIDGQAENPFFVDVSNGDYRLKPESVALGRGEALPQVVADALGWPTEVPVDLGAIQSEATPPSDDPIPAGTYRVIARHSDKVLDVSEVSKADEALLHQWSYRGKANQHWRVEPLDDGTYRFMAEHSGKTMDARKARTSNGTPIQQYIWNGTCAQRWHIEPVSSNLYTIRSACSDQVVEVEQSSVEDGALIQLWERTDEDNQYWQFAPVR
ncbi:MAG: hypothetical protein GFH27_549281n7 [Chloroflexi bacterium AL-W]|nr:hypothetical protein [Chloroflexi bacterium AL-N1]NOK65893.1 hypothetical protein [Chloroflexi bacterium AL-N10]NOK72774.1 hypothetical protein [Chloroflexi bacterium AL-N5]NOK79671.1 hypothetical protein [Chloroflexi bacterium AL-W]NOK92996.1 hypothetical protein [Chloroflexi bacterium AL-N15]